MISLATMMAFFKNENQSVQRGENHLKSGHVIEDENRIRPVILDHCCHGDNLSEVCEEGRNLLNHSSPGSILLVLEGTH
ncbi:hypothetical protein UPYG_G00166110 [Umbra pygmaea]|uniref:Uncharacterized protein n=1 Tax=Umbra pygmaea TaxID=75934 RepID=A0ABD0X6K6_UMBPY